MPTISWARTRRSATSIRRRPENRGTRAQSRRHRVRFIPEEPLRNACAPRMSVAGQDRLRGGGLDLEAGDQILRPPAHGAPVEPEGRRTGEIVAAPRANSPTRSIS
jgi:hypothetical protein